MVVDRKDVLALLDIVLIYVPPAPARQMLSELARSRVAGNDESFKIIIRRLIDALDERTRGGGGNQYERGGLQSDR